MYAVLRETVFIYDRMIMMPLPGPPGRSRRVRLLRESGRDFDDTDRAVAILVRPHLVAHLHPWTWPAAESRRSPVGNVT